MLLKYFAVRKNSHLPLAGLYSELYNTRPRMLNSIFSDRFFIKGCQTFEQLQKI
jgi:hypothetical protein